MEIESLSDADRIVANSDALDAVGREIAILEGGFAELEKLEGERDRLASAVRSLTEDEARTLKDDGSEAVIVKKLIELRTRRDVQSARLTSTHDRIKTQTTDLANQGDAVRRAFQFVVERLYVARETRVITTLTELFGSDWIILRDGKRFEMKHLARFTVLMREVRDLDIKVSHPIGDPAQEEIALRQRPRLWLTELADFVNREPGLVIRTVPVKQPQTIEETTAEVAAV